MGKIPFPFTTGLSRVLVSSLGCLAPVKTLKLCVLLPYSQCGYLRLWLFYIHIMASIDGLYSLIFSLVFLLILLIMPLKT